MRVLYRKNSGFEINVVILEKQREIMGSFEILGMIQIEGTR